MEHIKVTKILDYEKHGAFSTLLEYKEIKILLDCGLNDKFDISPYEEKSELLEKVDILLISSSEMKYSGGLIYLINKYNKFRKIYSTIPVKYILDINNTLCSMFLPFNKKDKNCVEHFKTFDILLNRIIELKFNQKIKIRQNNTRIKFIAFPKGKSLGSSYFEIKLDKIKIMYLVDYSLKSNLIINSLNCSEVFKKQYDLVITHLNKNLFSIGILKKKLKKNIKQISENNGKMILVVNEVTKIFEYIIMIKYIFLELNITMEVFLPTIYEFYIEFMKRLSEYMSDKVSQNFSFEDYIFDFNFLSIKNNNEFLNTEKSQIIFATEKDLTNGKSQEIFKKWNNPNNILFFLEKNKKKKKFQNNSEDNFKDFIESINGLKKINKNEPITDGKEKVEDDLITIETLETKNTKEEKMEIEEDINEKSDNYFNFKNDFIYYQKENKEIEKSIYGIILTDEELKIFNPFNFNNNLIEEDESIFNNNNNIEKSVVRNEEFYFKYNNFCDIKPLGDNYKINYQVENITNCEKVFQNHIIFLSNLNIKNILVFLNKKKIKESYFSYKTVEFENFINLDIKIDTIQIVIEENQFDDMKFKKYNNEISYQKVSMNFEKKNDKIKINVLKEKNNRYEMLKADNLLKLLNFLKEKGFEFILKYRHLNYNDKIFLIKKKDSYLLEGPFSEEYFKIRTEIYNFNWNED